MPRGNINNLIPNSQRTPEELKAITTKGGIKSGEARRRKRDMRQRMQAILDAGIVKESEIAKLLEAKFNIDAKNLDYGEALEYSMFARAFNGEIPFVDRVLELSGDKQPADININQTTSIPFSSFSEDELRENIKALRTKIKKEDSE